MADFFSFLFNFAGTIGTWFGEPITKEIVESAKIIVKAEWKRFNWPEAEQKYRQRLREQYRYTRLLGSSKLIEIENIFTDVYVLDQPSAQNRFSKEQLEETVRETRNFSSEYQKRFPLIDLVTKEKRIYLLGKPGAGKTTFLRYLIMQACFRKDMPTPIYVELKDWAMSGLKLMKYIALQFEICAFPDALAFTKYLLDRGYAIVLFDGLDEINQAGEQRAKMIQILRNFARRYPKAKIMLTCRVAATDYSFDQFTYLEIADFTDGQVQKLIQNWYRDEPKKGDRFLAELGMSEHRGIKELTSTPILLALLCLAFDETPEFPTNRTDLYKEALNALLKKWDASRNIRRDPIDRNLTIGRIEKMLARIAAENFENNHYLMSDDLLIKQILAYLKQLPGGDASEVADGEKVLQGIKAQHGILVERAHCINSFSHLTFQEYLTARYIVDNTENGALERLIRNHFTDERWYEVFLMTAGLLDDASKFFDIFLHSVEDLIHANTVCFDTLKWAFKIVEPKIVKHEKPINESIFLAFTYAIACDINFAIHQVLNNRLQNIPKLDSATDIASSLSYSDERTAEIERSRARDRVREINSARRKALDHAQSQAFLIASRYYRASCLSIALELVSNFNRPFASVFNSYAREFEFPNINFDHLTESLLDTLNQHYGIQLPYAQRKWMFDLEQYECFGRYIKANKLLFDCLALAVLPDRNAILSRMFIPE